MSINSIYYKGAEEKKLKLRFIFLTTLFYGQHDLPVYDKTDDGQYTGMEVYFRIEPRNNILTEYLHSEPKVLTIHIHSEFCMPSIDKKVVKENGLTMNTFGQQLRRK
ncbi:hypothetical protein J6590_010328 [Homalodisca vitripennis]|nr:hypothetical protein J6590_010328 [Homalodisca vitripennis]